MSEKKITLIIIGILLLFLGAQFSLEKWFLPSGQPLTGLFQDTIRYGGAKKWPEAEQTVFKLERAWSKYKYLISLNYAEEDYYLLKDTIVRVGNAVKFRDQSETTAQARAGLALWLNFLKFIPEP